MHIIKRPVASGSNVPACPTLIFLCLSLICKLLRIYLTTSNEVHLIGLSTKIILPFVISSNEIDSKKSFNIVT